MGYSNEKNIQLVIALLKAHNIKKVIASPGATNLSFIASLQQDPFFEIYSSVDERSAAYIACGLAAESGEPVVISCTGATASRNYMPGLTEAYYRKLPILAITSNAGTQRRYHLIAQQIDRSQIPHDVARISVDVPVIKDSEDEWAANVAVNRAILELTRNGGGPVHINLATTYSADYSVNKLPSQRVIRRISMINEFPDIESKRIVIFIGSHKKFNNKETKAIENFCAKYDAVVYCDHTSGYYGKYRIQYASIGFQSYRENTDHIDLLIHLGEISGDYYTLSVSPKEVWRVSIDGEIRDTFRKLHYVFEVPELLFFEKYAPETVENPKSSNYTYCKNLLDSIRKSIPELPFSNIWTAQQLSKRLPEKSELHIGILNSLRSWNFFDVPQNVETVCNVGGFGIDGSVSSLLGASLVSPEKIYFGIVGDLAFLYDLNSLANRHIGANIRILLVNNGLGVEFVNYRHQGESLGDAARPFIAAEGHFGHKSHKLVKHFSEDLGFEYLSASNKDEFIKNIDKFTTSENLKKPLLFEIFTYSNDENLALKTMDGIIKEPMTMSKMVKESIKSVLGEGNIIKVRKFMNI